MPPTASATIDEDLTRLERDIRQLKIEYEQYFGGGKSRPPNDVEWRIEQVLKRYGDRGGEMSFGQRFRYSNLTQTYAKYRDVFHKRLQKREAGSVDHHFGAAARAIESERARRGAPATVPIETAAGISAASSRQDHLQERAQERAKDEALYNSFRKALERAGKPTTPLSREKFEQFLGQKREQLRKQQGSREVEFIVSVEEGKPRLKARLKS